MPKSAPDALRAATLTQAYTQPIGAVVDMAVGANVEGNYLAANGQIVLRASYPALSGVLGTDQRFPTGLAQMHPTKGIFEQPWDFVYANGQWMVCGQSGVAVSTDGIGWTRVLVTPNTTFIHRLRYVNNTWFAIGYSQFNQNLLWKSVDGINWTQVVLPTSGASAVTHPGMGVSDIAYGAGKYLILYFGDGTFQYLTTPDLVTFTLCTWNNGTSYGRSVMFFNSQFVLLTSNGPPTGSFTNMTNADTSSVSMIKSPDAASGNWTLAQTLSPISLHPRSRLVVANTFLVLLAQRYAWISSDGNVYTQVDIAQSATANYNVLSVVYYQSDYHWTVGGANAGQNLRFWNTTITSAPTGYVNSTFGNAAYDDASTAATSQTMYGPAVWGVNLLNAVSGPAGTMITMVPFGFYETATSVSAHIPQWIAAIASLSYTQRRCAFIGRGPITTLANSVTIGGFTWYSTNGFYFNGLYSIDAAGVVRGISFNSGGAVGLFTKAFLQALNGASWIQALCNNGIWRSFDGGITWTAPVGSDTTSAISIATDGAGTICYIIQPGSPYFMRDSGLAGFQGQIAIVVGVTPGSLGIQVTGVPGPIAWAFAWNGNQWVVSGTGYEGTGGTQASFIGFANDPGGRGTASLLAPRS